MRNTNSTGSSIKAMLSPLSPLSSLIFKFIIQHASTRNNFIDEQGEGAVLGKP
jgi:hypothetical protein